MKKMFMLVRKSQIVAHAPEEFVGFFDSEVEALKRVVELGGLRFKGPNSPDQGKINVMMGILEQFSARQMVVTEPPILPHVSENVDLPDFCITVPSESNSFETYGIAFVNSTPVACTCPDFVMRRAPHGDWCKHMSNF